MKPQKKHITIEDNIKRIQRLIKELVLAPRIHALQWAKITSQTPNMKIGYPGQHLASLVVGMKGKRTAARGKDIIDGSEVKSCSRVDASDKCKVCEEKVSRSETICEICGSTDIVRDNTSKWLFTIRSQEDLDLLTKTVKRIILVLADYPGFDNNNFNDIQFQVFEIWTNSPRCGKFKEIMVDYYQNVYLSHKKKNSNKTPAPQNFWPYSFHFYLCNPIKVFSCVIEKANSSSPSLTIGNYVKPEQDRRKEKSEPLPTSLVYKREFIKLLKDAPIEIIKKSLTNEGDLDNLLALTNKKNFTIKQVSAYIPFIEEPLKDYLPIRKAKPFTIKKKHIRK